MRLRHHLLLATLLAAGSATLPALAQEPVPPTSADPTDPMPPQDATDALPPQEPADAMPPQESSTQAAPEAQTAPPATAGTIDDAKIEKFADAYIAVQTIQKKAANELQTAKDPAEVEKVKTMAESDMIAAVERNGLQVEEFNHIIETMTADANVRSRVAAKLQERQPDSGT